MLKVQVAWQKTKTAIKHIFLSQFMPLFQNIYHALKEEYHGNEGSKENVCVQRLCSFFRETKNEGHLAMIDDLINSRCAHVYNLKL